MLAALALLQALQLNVGVRLQQTMSTTQVFSNIAAMRLAFVLLILAPGCRHAPSAPAVPVCADSAVVTGSWQLIDRGAFSFRLPPGYDSVLVQPIDSHVERWEAGPLRAIDFDAGWYSSTLRELRGLQDYTECRVVSDLRVGLLVTGWDDEGAFVDVGEKFVVAATWREVQPGFHLTMAGITPNADELPTFVAMLMSVRFH